MSKNLQYSLGKIVFSNQQISTQIKEYAEKINKLYAERNLLIIGILNGSVFFITEFIKHLKIKSKLDFLAVSSYESTSKKTKIKFHKKIKVNPHQQDVLILEDIVDSGSTLALVSRFIEEQKPNSLRLCSLVHLQIVPQEKLSNLDTIFTLKTHKWLVGFGLDIDEKWRYLPDIHEINFEK